MNIEVNHHHRHSCCNCQTMKQFDCKNNCFYDDCIHSLSIVITNNNIYDTNIELDGIPNIPTQSTHDTAKSTCNITSKKFTSSSMYSCHQNNAVEADRLLGTREVSLWNENESFHSMSKECTTAGTCISSNSNDNDDDDDDDSIDNTSYSSFDIDEYSSSDGSSTTSDDIHTAFDIDNDNDDDVDDDDDDINNIGCWSVHTSEEQDDVKSIISIVPDCSNNTNRTSGVTHSPPLFYQSSSSISRKFVRFNTITVRSFHPEYDNCFTLYNNNPTKQGRVLCNSSIKEHQYQHQHRHQHRHQHQQRSYEDETSSFRHSCTAGGKHNNNNNNIVMIESLSSSSSSSCTMDDTEGSTDLTVDLRDYEWAKRNQRRRKSLSKNKNTQTQTRK